MASLLLCESARTILRFQELDQYALITGIVMLAVSLGWFVAVKGYLAGSEYKRFETEGLNNGFDNLVNLLEKSGYTKHSSVENVLVIYFR